MSATVLSFYSFKGGVGRTQALANMAVGLANRGKHVVVVDMDLESPGLHAFFYPEDRSKGPFKDDDFDGRSGFLEFVEKCFSMPEEEPKLLELLVPCTHPNHRPGKGSIRLLPAGQLTNDYPARVGAFSWENFYAEREGYRFMELFRDRLVHANADYVLVDSRTGMTDVANICTFQLPDVVVLLFALHAQGIEGASRVAQAIKRAQEEEGAEGRLRRVLLLPSRVEESGDHVLRDEWLLRARARLSDSGELLADLGQRIPYAAEFAYGEQIVIDAAEASILSRTYERVLDEILPRAPSVPAPKRPSFAGLRADLERLDQNVRAFARELEAVVLPRLPLLELRRFAHEAIRRRNAFTEEARAIQTSLRILAAESTPAPERAIDVDVESLESADDWIAIVDGLRLALTAQIEAWVTAQRRIVEAKLIEAADQDEALVRAALPEIERWIEVGELDEVEARLPAIQEEIARSGLEALLRRNELDRARLARSRPEPQAQNAWLDERLRGLRFKGSLDPASAPMLKNLLRLRAQTSDGPTHLHWSAYEALCSCMPDDPGESTRAFRTIGHWFWHHTWHAILAESMAAEDLRGLGGPNTRKHLERTLQHCPEAAADLVHELADGLIRLWGKGTDGREIARSIVEQRREDVILRAALAEIRSASARARRELLGSWLRDRDVSEPDVAMVHGLAEALVEEGYDAEAFYTLEAFRALGLPVGREGGLVYLAFLLRALEGSRGDLIEALLVDQEIREKIAELRTGKALLVLLAWQPARFPEKVQGLRHSVLPSLEHSAAIAPALPPVFLEMARDPLPFDVAKLAEFRSLERSIRKEYKAKKEPSIIATQQDLCRWLLADGGATELERRLAKRVARLTMSDEPEEET
jgi:cellulose biosynthesis protein BcsQ